MNKRIRKKKEKKEKQRNKMIGKKLVEKWSSLVCTNDTSKLAVIIESQEKLNGKTNEKI